jgi:thymidylate synthase ThyX
MDYPGKGRINPDRFAAFLLIYAKSTRLEHPLSVEEFQDAVEFTWTDDQIHAELKKIASTIESSWEFMDLTFELREVTRATAQQITRTRTGRFAMESQRVVSPEGVMNPFEGKVTNSSLEGVFNDSTTQALDAYDWLIDHGASKEDARGILPMNTQCRLLARYNLRDFIQLVRARRSLRTASEYARIVDNMIILVRETFPWVQYFLQSPYDKAIELLEEVVRDMGLVTGSGPGWQIAKAIDLLRK